MQVLTTRRSPALVAYAILASICLAAVAGIVAAAAPPAVLFSLVLLAVGALLCGVVVSRRRLSVIVLMLIAPLTGIVKGLTGSRYAPLPLDAAVVLVCAIQVLREVHRGRLQLDAVDLVHASFLGLALVQMLNPNVPSLQAGLEGFRKFAFASVAFYIGRHVINHRDWLTLTQASVVIAPLISIYAIKQFLYLSPVDLRMIELATASRVTYMMGGVVRPFATLAGPFHLGLYLATTAVSLFGLQAYVCRTPGKRLWLYAALALGFVALVLTRTKGNWVGLAVGLTALVLCHPARLSTRVRQIGLAVGLLGIPVLVLLVKALATRTTALDDALYAVAHPLSAPTFVYRVDLWRDKVLPALAANPLVGYGTSSAGEGLAHLYQGTGSAFFWSHSLYLKVFLELGLVGLVLVAILVLASLARAYRFLHARRRSRSLDVAVVRTCLAIVLVFLAAGLVIPVLDAYPANYLFWLALGMLWMPPVGRRP